jgi:uncharacterized membrane protein
MTTQEHPEAPPVPAHVVETLEAIAGLHKRAERQVPRHQRSIEASTALLGRSLTVFVIAGAIVVWMLFNAVWPAPPDPPPFAGLQVVASVGALLMTTMLWATQIRQRRPVEERERLELQISMQAEQKLTKLIGLVEELRRDMPDVVNRVDPVADAMAHSVAAHTVADALTQTLEQSEADDEEAANEA